MLHIKKVIGMTVAAASIALGSVAVAAPAQAAPSGCVANTYRYGSRGDCVRKIQAILNYRANIGVLPPGKVDGVFGAGTDDRVRRVQSMWWMTQDGIVGRRTWEALCAHNTMSAVQRAAGCATLH